MSARREKKNGNGNGNRIGRGRGSTISARSKKSKREKRRGEERRGGEVWWRDDWTDMACRGCTRAKNAVLSPSAVQKQLQASTVWMDGWRYGCVYVQYVCLHVRRYSGTVRYST